MIDAVDRWDRKLAVVCQDEAAATFIRAHIDRLPAEVTTIDGWPPRVDGVPLWRDSTARRARRRLWQLAGGDTDREAEQSYRQALSRSRPDLVLAEYGPTGVLVLPGCRDLEVPLVVHFHGYDASCRPIVEHLRSKYQRMFRESAALIAVSRSMRRQLIELGAPETKVHLNPYGVDRTAFTGARPADSDPIFLAVGRFVEKKSPATTIEAFATVKRDFPSARLRMIGDGPLLESCRLLARSLGLEKAVDFPGRQPAEVVQHQMRAARCFVQHSVTAPDGDSEGAPVAIMEASATGLPVVATRHAGIPEIVIDGETGFLVDEHDAVGMAGAMATFAAEPSAADRMGAAGRAHVLAEFSIERSIEGLWTICESAMDLNRDARGVEHAER